MNRQSSQPTRRRKYTQHQRDEALADADQLVAEHKEHNGKVEAFNGNLHTVEAH